MKRAILIALAAGAATLAAVPAQAREGCGPGYHRGPAGHCRPNGDRVVTERWVVGNYYNGRGYWDGQRWWHHRRRLHDRWHYY